jgi:hypothetical protein
LDRVLAEVRERLEASRQAVEEYERLEGALAALGREPSAAAAPPAAKPPRAAVPRAQSAANRERLLALIGERPGVTREEIRAATGLSGAAVAQGLRRAIAAGRVREEPLPGGQPGFSLLPEDAASRGAAPESAEVEPEPPDGDAAAPPQPSDAGRPVEAAEAQAEPPAAEPEAESEPAPGEPGDSPPAGSSGPT